MAIENFLINPHRVGKRRRKVKGMRRRRKGGLPSALLKRMMKTYGPRQGMKRAWSEYRRGVRSNVWSGHRQAHRRASGVGWSSRRVGTSGYAKRTGAHYPRWHNPLGEEVMIVGANPRRHRRRRVKRNYRRKEVSLMRVKRRRRRRRVVRMNDPGRKRRVYRRRRRVYAFNDPGRRRRRGRRRSYPVTLYRRNRVRRYKRRYRRNPAVALGLSAISWRRPMSLLMPCAVGVGAYMACDMAPVQLGMTGNLQRLGVKAGVGVGGMILLRRFIGSQNATVWGIVAGVNILQDILKTFVFKTAVSGLGMYTYQGYDAYPSAGYTPYDANPY